MTEATAGRYVFTAGKPPPPEVMDRLRRWWLEESGLSREELRELGAAIWPDAAQPLAAKPD